MMRGGGGGIRRKVPMTISGFILKKKKSKRCSIVPSFSGQRKKNTPKTVTTLHSQKLPSWLLIGCSLDDMHQPVLHPYILRGSLNSPISTLHCEEKVLENNPFATCLLLLSESSSEKKKKVPISWPCPSWEGFLFSTHFSPPTSTKLEHVPATSGKRHPSVPRIKFPGKTPAAEGGWDRNCHRTTTVWMMFL